MGGLLFFSGLKYSRIRVEIQPASLVGKDTRQQALLIVFRPAPVN